MTVDLLQIQVFECLEQNKQQFFHNLTKEMPNKLKPVCTAVVAYSWSYSGMQPLRGCLHSWILKMSAETAGWDIERK